MELGLGTRKGEDFIGAWKGWKLGAHQRFIAKNLPAGSVDNRLKIVGKQVFIEQTVQFLVVVDQIGFLHIVMHIEFPQLTLAGVLGGIHRKVCIVHQLVIGLAVVREPRDARRRAEAEVRIVRQRHQDAVNLLLHLADLLEKGLPILSAIGEEVEFIP